MTAESGQLPVKQEFGGTTQIAAYETAANALAARARANVEARYIMAMRQPRVWEQVRQDILAECRRPAFANNKSAFYSKPIGDGVTGLGIRYAEVAVRCMKNVSVEVEMIYEDADKEIQRVTATDLESNVPLSIDVRVTKTVERSRPSDDGSYLSMRKNTYGKSVYTVPATDDDLLNKRSALVSKAFRTQVLRLVPGDIKDESEAIILKIRADRAAADPTAERNAILDGFAELNVRAADLLAYVGHPLEQCSPAELVTLRGLYGALKDGEITWVDAVDQKAQRGDKAPENAAKATYPEAEFKKGLPRYQKAIASGAKTHDEVIAMLQSKCPLSPEQIDEIKKSPGPVLESAGKPAAAEIIEAMLQKAREATITTKELATFLGVTAEDLHKLTAKQVDRALSFIADPFGDHP